MGIIHPMHEPPPPHTHTHAPFVFSVLSFKNAVPPASQPHSYQVTQLPRDAYAATATLSAYHSAILRSRRIILYWIIKGCFTHSLTDRCVPYVEATAFGVGMNVGCDDCNDDGRTSPGSAIAMERGEASTVRMCVRKIKICVIDTPSRMCLVFCL